MGAWGFVATLATAFISTAGLVTVALIQRSNRKETHEARRVASSVLDSVGLANGGGTLQDQVTALRLRGDALSYMLNEAQAKLSKLQEWSESHVGAEAAQIKQLSIILNDLHDYTHDFKHSVINKQTGQLLVVEMLTKVIQQVDELVARVAALDGRADDTSGSDNPGG